MGKRDDYYAKSVYFGADEMAGRTLKLTIVGVEDTEFETDSKTVLKPVLTFRDQERKLVVGAMNYDRLADVFGDETKGWVGRTIVLKGEKVPFRGKRVNSIIAQPYGQHSNRCQRYQRKKSRRSTMRFPDLAA